MAKRYNTDAPEGAFEIKRRALTWNCAGCGEGFQSIRKRLYCKPTCQGKARKSREAPGKPGWWICAGCGEEFESERRLAYCRRECKAKVQHRSAMAIEPVPASCNARGCHNVAATWHTTGKRAGLWCSLACASRTRPHKSVRTFKGACHDCGAVFVFSRESKGRQRHCEECRGKRKEKRRQTEARARRRRRARLAGALTDSFTIEDIARRDGGWNCYMCGVDTIPHFKGGYHPNAATVDHVIPISRMGPDILANAKIACHRCNSLKATAITMTVTSLSLFDFETC